MSDTVIDSILDAIATAATAIDGTGSYETNVKSVNEEPTNHATEIAGLSPSLDITLQKLEQNDGQGSPRAMFAGEVRVALIDITGYVQLEKQLVGGVQRYQKPHKAWLPLARDVERMVKANSKWSALALKTELVECVPEYAETEVLFAQTIRVYYLKSRA